MLVKSKVIILHTIPFKETSIITYGYSQENGRISFLINGVRKKKSTIKLNLFQPLSILDIIYYSNEKSELFRIKEIERHEILSEIPYLIEKNAIANFISEIIYRIIKEEVKNEGLFEFMYYSIKYLDKIKNNTSIFSLLFLVQLSKYVGIMPINNYSEFNKYFDIQNGNFRPENPNDRNCLSKKLSKNMNKLLSCSFAESEFLSIEKKERKELLNRIIDYYQIHLNYHVNIRSLKILEEIFN